jgi:hypothetical protein
MSGSQNPVGFSSSLKQKNSWVWWHTPLIPALRRLRQEDREYEASLCCILRFCLKNKQQSGHLWFIRAIREAETEGIEVPGQLRQKVHETPSQQKKAGYGGKCLSSQPWKNKMVGLLSRPAGAKKQDSISKMTLVKGAGGVPRVVESCLASEKA